ncbi:hypothetical protein SPHINGO8BC_60403 [Sphingobacterium multivorum]|uniref:Uncharacterized protein n=1 Tax=Sphingobacterium multivorum TaxID=28454 RepID=A0A654DI43_SPHMU|nr:hypothetical protein SPHINGO8BC_60403 [Sphingobacterium multivorum]
MLSHDPSHWRAEILPNIPQSTSLSAGIRMGDNSAITTRIISGVRSNMLTANGQACTVKSIRHCT